MLKTILTYLCCSNIRNTKRYVSYVEPSGLASNCISNNRHLYLRCYFSHYVGRDLSSSCDSTKKGMSLFLLGTNIRDSTLHCLVLQRRDMLKSCWGNIPVHRWFSPSLFFHRASAPSSITVSVTVPITGFVSRPFPGLAPLPFSFL